MFLWLADMPDTETMHHLLNTNDFCKRVKHYLDFSIHADVPGIHPKLLDRMERESQVAYSRPPDPFS